MLGTLIIPDLHHHTDNADHWLATVPHDRAVFLGDYFDNFGDDVGDARRTAIWLRERLANTEDVFLLGNHDIPYMFPDASELFCPGFTPAKAHGIREILRPEHWARFRLAHAEQGWLMSHAGFHPDWTKKPEIKPILNRCELAMRRAKRRVVDPIFGAGIDRGGSLLVGGPLWLDWNSFIPISGIHQILGHTPGGHVRDKTTKRSKNYCIDVRNGSAAGILADGKMKIFLRE